VWCFSVSLWDLDPGWIMLAVVVLWFISMVVYAVACARDPSICSDSSN